MKQVFYILLFLLSLQLQAQKVIEKQLDAKSISTIEIQGNDIFKIDIETSKEETITIKAEIEGEYSEHIVLSVLEKDKTLYISNKFQPLFKNKNDKLSAHKVISIEMKISIPKHLKLRLKSDIASVKINGNYKSVFIELQQGNCNLNNFLGQATVNTIQGDINGQTNNAHVKAFTRNGKLNLAKINNGINTLILNSINGNITVTKTK